MLGHSFVAEAYSHINYPQRMDGTPIPYSYGDCVSCLGGLGGPPLPPPLATSFATFIPIRGGSGGCLAFLAFSLLPLEFVTLSFLYVTFVLVVTTFATITTGDGTPEMVLVGHSFPILGVLLSLHLQHTTTFCTVLPLNPLGARGIQLLRWSQSGA